MPIPVIDLPFLTTFPQPASPSMPFRVSVPQIWNQVWNMASNQEAHFKVKEVQKWSMSMEPLLTLHSKPFHGYSPHRTAERLAKSTAEYQLVDNTLQGCRPSLQEAECAEAETLCSSRKNIWVQEPKDGSSSRPLTIIPNGQWGDFAFLATLSSVKLAFLVLKEGTLLWDKTGDEKILKATAVARNP